jgi:membrane protease YdiL (CAAX protease family)
MKGKNIPTIAGLVISLILPGIFLLDAVGDVIKNLPDFLNGIGFWLLTVALILVVLFWEKKPLSSIGLKKLTWKTFAIGFGSAFVIIMSYPLIALLVKALGLMGSEEGLEEISKFPTWVLIIFCIQAGVVEEILYRSYPMERILTWSKSKSLAIVLPLIIFILLHLPFWGPGHLIFVGLRE